MKTKEKTKSINVKDVNFSDFNIQYKEISINGKKLPLCIGDWIIISEADPLYKTITGVTISEDSRVQYILEWYDISTNSFKSEVLTLQELKLLCQAKPDTQVNSHGVSKRIGF